MWFWIENQGYQKGVMKSPSTAKKSCWDQECVRGTSVGGPERPLLEAVRVNLNCVGDLKMLEMSELWDTNQGELLIGYGTSPREISVLQSTMLKEVGDMKNFLISKTEVQNLEFSLMVYSLALDQYLFTKHPFIPFRMGEMYILCH